MDFSRSPPTLFSLIANYSMILLEAVMSHITDILEKLFKIERVAHNEILTLLTSVTRTSINFLGRISPFRFTFKQLERKEVKVSAFLQLL